MARILSNIFCILYRKGGNVAFYVNTCPKFHYLDMLDSPLPMLPHVLIFVEVLYVFKMTVYIYVLVKNAVYTFILYLFVVLSLAAFSVHPL